MADLSTLQPSSRYPGRLSQTVAFAAIYGICDGAGITRVTFWGFWAFRCLIDWGDGFCFLERKGNGTVGRIADASHCFRCSLIAARCANMPQGRRRVTGLASVVDRLP